MNENYYQTIYQIITTGHWITDEISRTLAQDGITEPQYNVLRILSAAKGEPLTVGAILNKMVQRSSNITRIVDKLVAKNLASRSERPSNRRKMDIALTSEGRDLLKHLDLKVQTFHKPYQTKLNDKELSTLRNLILKLKA